MHEHHLVEASVTFEQQKKHGNFLSWINRLIGTVVMFIACLAVCHFAGIIHLNPGHF